MKLIRILVRSLVEPMDEKVEVKMQKTAAEIGRARILVLIFGWSNI